jgi:glycosyltransferase involved in cell wall biosynthesis
MTHARTLVASSLKLVPEERFEILVHALAQLPDEVRLHVWGEGPARKELELLSQAYGIGSRVVIDSDRPLPRSGRVIYPSAQNVATAPLRPSDSAGSAVALDGAPKSVHEVRSVRTFAELLEELSESGDASASLRMQDEAIARQRVAIVTNVPAPYRLPLLSKVNERLQAVDARMRVFFLGNAPSRRPWMATEAAYDFDYQVLRSFSLPWGVRRSLVPFDLERKLARYKPSLVLSAGLSPFVSARASAFAHQRDVPFGIWSGETALMGTARNRMRKRLRREIVRRTGFGLAYGSASAEFLRELAPSVPVVHGRNTSVSELGSRKTWRRSNVLELLTVGDLSSSRKGIDVAIDAVRIDPDLQCRLTIVGDGVQRPSLEERARDDRRIRFVGSLPPDRVTQAYGAADVFLFPTRADVFGLVLAEAMGAGLPTIVSAAPGAVPDLAVDGRTCIVVDNLRPASWAEAIRRLSEDEDLRSGLGSRAREVIGQRWTIAHSADAFIAGLRLGMLSSKALQGTAK